MPSPPSREPANDHGSEAIRVANTDERTSWRTTSAAPGGRARILDVARAAFIARGFADVSMQEIADAAGLTKAAIYYHFADKEDLFEQVFLAEVDRLCDGLVAQLAPGGPLREQVVRVARFAFQERRGDFGRLIADAHRYCSAERLLAIRDRVNSPYTLIRAAFAQAQTRGEVRTDVDLDMAVMLFLGMVSSQMKFVEIGLTREPAPEAFATMVADMVMGGIGA